VGSSGISRNTFMIWYGLPVLYPYKWLWTYAGNKNFEAVGENKFLMVLNRLHNACLIALYCCFLPLQNKVKPNRIGHRHDCAYILALNRKDLLPYSQLLQMESETEKRASANQGIIICHYSF
jgi:hypothetical protein